MEAFFTGVATGFSLILAIGAQNAFVLRQGLLRQHFFAVALFCSLSDAILIAVGVSGVSLFIGDVIKAYSFWVFGAAAVWLMVYGTTHLRSAFRQNQLILDEVQAEKSLLSVLSTAALFTFGNPHVYLDTVVLIGTMAMKFVPYERVLFAAGASLASFVFFFSLAYGARLLAPKMKNQTTWKILDVMIAVIMFSLAFGMLIAGDWFN
ncbi:LysE family transporter [Alphaproteobacteria bacterium]|nr:LysE family transporter [Alphaproteobacteria bacterium]